MSSENLTKMWPCLSCKSTHLHALCTSSQTMSLLAAQALELKLVSLVNSSTFQREKNILQFRKHRQISGTSTCRSHLLKHQKTSEGICRLLCCRSGDIAVLELVIRQPTCTSTRSRDCKSSGIRSSHPRFRFHSLCKIFLASRTTRETNPMGSYSELTADRITRLVGGWWGSRTLNKKAFSPHPTAHLVSFLQGGSQDLNLELASHDPLQVS